MLMGQVNSCIIRIMLATKNSVFIPPPDPPCGLDVAGELMLALLGVQEIAKVSPSSIFDSIHLGLVHLI